MPISVSIDKPKSQHHELLASFFKLVLGNNLKYSFCYFSPAPKILEDAEEEKLKLYCERPNLKDGHTVPDVGCGWSSIFIFLDSSYGNCISLRIVLESTSYASSSSHRHR
ncbi:unnamed protein product [Vicia faba]|uniref:Uncharacterized protein n=1 Tax=Vicia faba TaxID=3906 RepID=A0AAV0YUJ2_VICFA|nr:unnamed protein product [Vicia faba]